MSPGPRRLALDRRAFGANFDRLFTAEDVRARSLALDLGVGEDKVSKWRKGKLPVPDTATLVRIAIRFRVSVDVLLAGVNTQYLQRADPTHEKKPYELTSSVMKPAIQDRQAPSSSTEGEAHAEPAAETADSTRLSQSGSTSHAQMRNRYKANREIVKLYRSADTIRAIADTLRAALETGRTGAKRSRRPDGDPDVRRTGTRRGR